MQKRMDSKCALARDYLLQVKEKYLAVTLAKERYAQDRELIFGGGGIDYSKEHVDGGKVKNGNEQVEAMIDRWTELKALEKDYLATTKLISSQLNCISYYHGKDVLTRRYLLISPQGRLKTLEQITEELGLTDLRYTQRIHVKALKEFYNRFLDDDASVQKP